jgi:hypothetical protein
MLERFPMLPLEPFGFKRSPLPFHSGRVGPVRLGIENDNPVLGLFAPDDHIVEGVFAFGVRDKEE